jgi:uncharacterized protein YidB (DUF937 family)
MGLLEGVIGGICGAEMATVVNGLIAKHGGIGGIVQEFKTKGLEETVKSWVSTGANLPISADQIHQALGSDTVAKLAAKVGMTPAELSEKLSAVLPDCIDKLTPNGVIPAQH